MSLREYLPRDNQVSLDLRRSTSRVTSMEGEGWTLLSSIRTGLWRTGPELFGQMRQKSTELGQMEGCMCEKKQGSLFRTRNSEA